MLVNNHGNKSVMKLASKKMFVRPKNIFMLKKKLRKINEQNGRLRIIANECVEFKRY